MPPGPTVLLQIRRTRGRTCLARRSSSADREAPGHHAGRMRDDDVSNESRCMYALLLLRVFCVEINKKNSFRSVFSSPTIIIITLLLIDAMVCACYSLVGERERQPTLLYITDHGSLLSTRSLASSADAATRAMRRTRPAQKSSLPEVWSGLFIFRRLLHNKLSLGRQRI